MLRWGAASGAVDGGLWRVVTATFAHISVVHLVGNMVVLGFVGRMVEGAHGSLAFVAVYLVTGTAGGIAAVVVDPTESSQERRQPYTAA